MKLTTLLVIVIVLLVFTMPMTAQDHVPAADEVPVGSVSTSQTRMLVPKRTSPFISPDQIGANGQAEAIVGMTWYPQQNIVGTAISKIIAGNSTYNVCAQVIKVSRNGANMGGSGRNCGQINPGGRIQADHRVWYNWGGATWRTETWHQFTRTNVHWAPTLQVSANL